MKRLDCPHCGPRDEIEFTWGGQAHIVRPDVATCSDEEWRDYLFIRTNPRGIHHERWCHTYGCGQWFHVARDTVTHRVARVYGIAESCHSERSEESGEILHCVQDDKGSGA